MRNWDLLPTAKLPVKLQMLQPSLMSWFMRTLSHDYLIKPLPNSYLLNFEGLLWVFVALHSLFLIVASRGYSWSQCLGSHFSGLSCCGKRARGHGLQLLWHTGLVALWHVESSWIRDRTHVPCTGRWILIHCATREVLPSEFGDKNTFYMWI